MNSYRSSGLLNSKMHSDNLISSSFWLFIIKSSFRELFSEKLFVFKISSNQINFKSSSYTQIYKIFYGEIKISPSVNFRYFFSLKKPFLIIRDSFILFSFSNLFFTNYIYLSNDIIFLNFFVSLSTFSFIQIFKIGKLPSMTIIFFSISKQFFYQFITFTLILQSSIIFTNPSYYQSSLQTISLLISVYLLKQNTPIFIIQT
ncbi:hypothetical protein IMG5_196830 [Ichthyophthirius multifiliis]|uniref:Transmembrane protein n=1 Tax=Ichthyophthirius multifiliis TaxID=5932 RepID=G0R580_ICHMU|nr:hypothetical protein IMG5_196830 [Ichthyophthirius multifiliis]EGR27373.1 hypothetical protein IMG5_196830 [Ichthyophthirius multifiliis]|eukprot:XP_004024257.1 hypothetical protein IMG5_196830 [Ichthyophthirius multifiliis]